MKKFECKDMGLDCGFVATGVTTEQVIGLALEHAIEVHSEMLSSLSPEQSENIQNMLEMVIRDTTPQG